MTIRRSTETAAGAKRPRNPRPKKILAAAVVLSLVGGSPAAAIGPPDVPAEGKNGCVAGTTSAAAQRAGLEALRRGGSAADAALVTSLTQVAEAMGSWVSYAGIFSMVYYDAASGRFTHLNAGYNTVLGEDDPMSIPALENALSPKPDGAFTPSGRTALVPGYMAGVQAAHRKFGKLPFRDLFEPAIRQAEKGFELTTFHARMIALRRKPLARLPETKAIFTKPDGSWYGEGDVFKQPALAATLRQIADQGAGYMYTGEWARKFVEAVRSDGGKMTLDDLKSYEVIWSDPMVAAYGDCAVYLPAPPALGGVHIAEALNVAAQAGLAGMGRYSESPRAFFWLSQITGLMALSFVPPQMASQWLGGADVSPTARAGAEHARRLWSMMAAGKFPLTRLPASVEPKHSDAVVAIDRWGNMAAVVHSSNTVVWGTTGLFVDGISIPDSAAIQQPQVALAGRGRRLPDPTEPLIIAREGRPIAALSSIGAGLHQKTMCALVNLLDFHMDLKAALDAPALNAPRYEAGGGSRPQVLEGDFSPQLLAGLKALGLEPAVVPNMVAPGVPRGYVISGYMVGAAIHPKGVYQAAAPADLGGRALAY